MNQILDDYLHRDLGQLKKSARHLRTITSGAGWLGAVATGQLGGALQRLYPTIREQDLCRWQPELAGLVQQLADEVGGVLGSDSPPWQETGGELDLSRVPASLRRAVIRLPRALPPSTSSPPTSAPRAFLPRLARAPERLLVHERVSSVPRSAGVAGPNLLAPLGSALAGANPARRSHFQPPIVRTEHWALHIPQPARGVFYLLAPKRVA